MRSFRRVYAVILFTFGCVSCLWGQGFVLRGTVRDGNSYHEIHNVNVFVKDKPYGTTTDLSGSFELRLPQREDGWVIVFRHIGYEERELTIGDLGRDGLVYLQPRVIPLKGVTIEESAQKMEIMKDIPQTISMVEARRFESRGFVDAGDLLKMDHSVQVEEDLSGKKTASMRGGNPDELVVLYNGVKMNRTYDNTFDFSLIDLEDVERFEIIKGSNTALYGPEAFSGVVNIIPRVKHDYIGRFHQRVGSYRSGNWGFHLSGNLNKLDAAYSLKRGAYRRYFSGEETEENQLENLSLHHTANVYYSFSEPDGVRRGSGLGAVVMYSVLDYDNRRDLENMRNRNVLASLRYHGDLLPFLSTVVSVSMRQFDEEQYLVSGIGSIYRDMEDRGLHLHLEEGLKIGNIEAMMAYQFEYSELNFRDRRSNFAEIPAGLESARFYRGHHGMVLIGKVHRRFGTGLFRDVDLSGSVRYDYVNDEQVDTVIREGSEYVNQDFGDVGYFGQNEWGRGTFKLGMELSGYEKNLEFSSYLSFGLNTKFPTLYQQLSSPASIVGLSQDNVLKPEQNRSVELGVKLGKDIRDNPTIYGWTLSGIFFQNHYDDKIRVSSTPGIPVSFFDTVPDARITGFEGKWSVYFFRKKLGIELGLSKYFISEKSAFPFKADSKRTLNIIVEHRGYSFQAHLFGEGEQVGWIRQINGSFIAIVLPTYENIDLHMSKTFRFGRLEILTNISARNVVKGEEIVVRCLAIRDRRYYLTLGIQY